MHNPEKETEFIRKLVMKKFTHEELANILYYIHSGMSFHGADIFVYGSVRNIADPILKEHLEKWVEQAPIISNEYLAFIEGELN